MARNESPEGSLRCPVEGLPEVKHDEQNQESILSCELFADHPGISPCIKQALANMGITHMTQIQTFAIPKLLEGRDVLGAAKTGSGKTLAFIIPAFELLWKLKANHKQGTIVLVLAPTRELVLQMAEVVREVGQGLTHTFGAIVGGGNRKEEQKRLLVGINLLLATPGRLLDHLEHTKGWRVDNIAMLILDEADRMLEVGFERELSKILNLIPKDRQTALFSATQTTKVADLVRMSLRKPVLVQVQDEIATVKGLKQYYIVCESGERLCLLYRILKDKSRAKVKTTDGIERGLKIMVFFSSCASAQFHEDLFRLFKEMLPIRCLHGKKKQGLRTQVYNAFCVAPDGILFCTNVAARGLDFPQVDYIIQYDPPDEARDYIHRVGRTARGVSGVGLSMLFLLPEELEFLTYLQKERVHVSRVKAEYHSLQRIQDQLIRIVGSTPELEQQAKRAYETFLLAYESHSFKNVFNLDKLNLEGVSQSFALQSPPRRKRARRK